jgi:acyl carrier protein
MLSPTAPHQIEELVHGKIRAVLQERFGEVRAFDGSAKLNATLGLSSLDLAFLVADLEADVGIDPFAKLVSITSIRSVDDLVRAYRAAIVGDSELEMRDDGVAAALARADARRGRRTRT